MLQGLFDAEGDWYKEYNKVFGYVYIWNEVCMIYSLEHV